MTRYYAGIGSRSTPDHILEIMSLLAQRLEGQGLRLRSGGAEGADTAFEVGVRQPATSQIFLPWSGFNNRVVSKSQPQFINYQSLPASPKARASVEEFHPKPHGLKPGAKHLMARNAMQVLGPDLSSPSAMVIAYTPGGMVEGGTGQALRIAQRMKIPIKNLGDDAMLESILQYLNLL